MVTAVGSNGKRVNQKIALAGSLVPYIDTTDKDEKGTDGDARRARMQSKAIGSGARFVFYPVPPSGVFWGFLTVSLVVIESVG